MLQFELYNELLIQLLYNEPRMCIRKVNRVKCVQLNSIKCRRPETQACVKKFHVLFHSKVSVW